MEQTQTISKPELSGFPVFIDGRLDRVHEAKRYGILATKLVGFAMYKTLEISLGALDELTRKPDNSAGA